MSKVLLVGDAHFRDYLSYSEHFPDKREKEKREVLDFIITTSRQCDKVILLGDILNQRNNSSKTIKELVGFLERFTKPVYMIAGNHEKYPDGKSALDFLKEIKGKQWTIITNEVARIDNFVFCPYFFYPELGTSNKQEASSEALRKIKVAYGKALKEDMFLFIHHALSDTTDYGGINTNQYNEVVLDRKDLDREFRMVFGGHIHLPSVRGNVYIAGSVFANKVGDEDKYIYILDTELRSVEKLKLPGRKIIKINYTTLEDLLSIDYPAVIKVHVKKDEDVEAIEDISQKLLKEKGQALIVIKESEKSRMSLNVTSTKNILDMPLEALLELYAEKRGIPADKLKRALRTVS